MNHKRSKHIIYHEHYWHFTSFTLASPSAPISAVISGFSLAQYSFGASSVAFSDAICTYTGMAAPFGTSRTASSMRERSGIRRYSLAVGWAAVRFAALSRTCCVAISILRRMITSSSASRSALVPPQPHSLGPQKKGGQSLLHRKTPIFPGAHREDRCFCFQLRGKQMAIAVPAK